MARGIEQRARIYRLLVRHKAIEIVKKSSARPRPTLTEEVHLFRAHASKIEAGANRKRGETRVVLDAAEALFGDSEKHFAIARDARGGIMHLRVINSQG